MPQCFVGICEQCLMVTPKENQYHQHLPQDDKPGDPFAKKINEPSFRRIASVAFALVIGS